MHGKVLLILKTGHNEDNKRAKTKEQQESFENAKICFIFKDKFESKHLKDKKYFKVRDHCHYTREELCIAYVI